MPTVTFDMINKIVSFNLYPASIITTTFERVKILAILDADSALAMGIDVQSQHINVYPTIAEIDRPENNFRSYQYLKLKLPNGDITAIGIPWINGAITIHTNQRVRADIDDVGPQDLDKIRKVLIANGYNSVSLSFLD